MTTLDDTLLGEAYRDINNIVSTASSEDEAYIELLEYGLSEALAQKQIDKHFYNYDNTTKEDFTHIGYVVYVDIDNSYEYYFLNDITTPVKEQMQEKLISKPNPASKFYCSLYEIYKINNDNYIKFKTKNSDIIKCLKNFDYDDNIIVTKEENFIIDTTVYPHYIQQINTLQDIINFKILHQNNNSIDIDNINKAIDILQSLKQEHLKNPLRRK